MHDGGDANTNLASEKTFAGISLLPHIGAIKGMIEQFGAQSLLDYGCGKASSYEQLTLNTPDGPVTDSLANIWGINDFGFYDPGYAPFAALPERKFDAVISTDMLEHCPEEDLPWIISEIFEFSQVFVFCFIALYPAKKSLPNGDNAHITQRPIG